MRTDEDKVFKALADVSRRTLLDRLRREKLHFLNPVPIHEIWARWIGKFQQSHLEALYTLKQALKKNKDD